MLGEHREAPLIIVSVEAAVTRAFLMYSQGLVARQKLDRIIIDECHLTVIAVQYRPVITELTMLRSLRTQFVYLSATLPPSMQEEFNERNHLLRPAVVRALSNRSNLAYSVYRAITGKGSLLEQAVALAQKGRVRFSDPHDKIILYAREQEEADQLARMLGCRSYMAKSGTALEKQQILASWIASVSQPFIVATTALAEGFDYPHVRVVINVNAPDSLITFAQESRRAGRDGRKAYSVVLLPTSWQAQTEAAKEGELRDG